MVTLEFGLAIGQRSTDTIRALIRAVAKRAFGGALPGPDGRGPARAVRGKAPWRPPWQGTTLGEATDCARENPRQSEPRGEGDPRPRSAAKRAGDPGKGPGDGGGDDAHHQGGGCDVTGLSCV